MTVPVTVRTHNFLERLFYHFAALHLFLSVMFVDFKEGDSRVCGHGQFFLRYFGNFNLKMQCCVFDGIENYPPGPGRFWSLFQFPIGLGIHGNGKL